MKRIYYTYLVILTEGRLKGKVYFGKHVTSNINDKYIGSGAILTRYLKKYPNDYYREIIKFYSSEEELNKAEEELIAIHLGKDYCINLMKGGYGYKINNKYALGYHHSEEEKEKIRIARKNQTPPTLGYHHSEETKQKISIAQKGKIIPEYQRKKMSDARNGKYNGTNNPFYGKHHTEEFKEKHSKLMKGCSSPIKGKHKVWDDKDKNIYHYE